jgi:HPt (histidine-containing phosphotransfer) domain-containing protein
MGDGVAVDLKGGSEAVDARVLEELRETVGGDDGFFEELLRTYVTDGAAQLDTMKRALEVRDAETLGRAAHSLKSNSAGVGAARLGALCAALEALARGGELEEATGRLAEAETEFQHVTEDLHRRLTAGASGSNDAGSSGAMTGATQR